MEGLSLRDRFWKRVFDLVGAAVGLLLFGWLIIITYLLARLDTGESGFFYQTRIGKDGKPFQMIKIRTMCHHPHLDTTVTTTNDPRTTRLGQFLRQTKLDELPQLINVLRGEMSFVGPRPDVPGYADELCGADRIILTIRPGITGPATIKYRNEEFLLAQQPDPEKYNREVIFPDKVKINSKYIQEYDLLNDLKYIWRTLRSG